MFHCTNHPLRTSQQCFVGLQGMNKVSRHIETSRSSSDLMTSTSFLLEPEFDVDGTPICDIISVDSIARACHLILVFGEEPIEQGFDLGKALDSFFMNLLQHAMSQNQHKVAKMVVKLAK